jgi:hypothetical protein
MKLHEFIGMSPWRNLNSAPGMAQVSGVLPENFCGAI